MLTDSSQKATWLVLVFTYNQTGITKPSGKANCNGSRLKMAGLAIIPSFGSNYLPVKIRSGSH
jgi:hypothetical protein